MNIFTEQAAQQRWERFEARLEEALSCLAPADREDLRTEIRDHAIEAYHAMGSSGDELYRLSRALIDLGDPVEFLRPAMTDRLIERGTRGFRPISLARGLIDMTAQGGRIAVIGFSFLILYSALGTFGLMAVLKLFRPDVVGLYRMPNGQVEFGVVAAHAGAQELLGYATVPVALGVAALSWWLLGRLLRFVRRR